MFASVQVRCEGSQVTLGNFSTDKMVIDVEKLKRNTEKPSGGRGGGGLTHLVFKRICLPNGGGGGGGRWIRFG